MKESICDGLEGGGRKEGRRKKGGLLLHGREFENIALLDVIPPGSG